MESLEAIVIMAEKHKDKPLFEHKLKVNAPAWAATLFKPKSNRDTILSVIAFVVLLCFAYLACSGGKLPTESANMFIVAFVIVFFLVVVLVFKTEDVKEGDDLD